MGGYGTLCGVCAQMGGILCPLVIIGWICECSTQVGVEPTNILQGFLDHY